MFKFVGEVLLLRKRSFCGLRNSVKRDLGIDQNASLVFLEPVSYLGLLRDVERSDVVLVGVGILHGDFLNDIDGVLFLIILPSSNDQILSGVGVIWTHFVWILFGVFRSLLDVPFGPFSVSNTLDETLWVFELGV